jgi:hypothetical protein
MRSLRNPSSVMRRAASVKECISDLGLPSVVRSASVTASAQPLHLETILLLIPLFYFLV